MASSKLPGTTVDPSRTAQRAQRQAPSSPWSLIVRAQGTGPEARAALGVLLRRYERTIERWIGVKHPPTMSVEDLRQQFIVGVLRRGDIANLNRNQWTFRRWLSVAVRYFMRSRWSEYYRIKEFEGGNATDFDIEQHETPERRWMQEFVWDTLLLARERHRQCIANDAKFEHIQRFIPGPGLDLESIAVVAAERGVPPNRVSVEKRRTLERHARIVRELIAETLDVDPTTPEGQRAIEVECETFYCLLTERAETEVKRVEV